MVGVLVLSNMRSATPAKATSNIRTKEITPMGDENPKQLHVEAPLDTARIVNKPNTAESSTIKTPVTLT